MTVATEISGSIRHSDRLYIGGEWVEPSSESVFDVGHSGPRGDFGIVIE